MAMKIFFSSGVGFYAGDVAGVAGVLVVEHDAAAPVGVFVDVWVGEYDKAETMLSGRTL